jgi:hypothetical protein
MDVTHSRQIDHQATVADRIAGDVMTASPYGDEQIVFATEIHRRDDVGGAGTSDDNRGATVDHSIPDTSGLIVTRRRRQ